MGSQWVLDGRENGIAMAVDSGSYTPETIARNRKIADQLLMDAVKTRPIRHWAEGLGQLGEAGLGGYMGYQADQQEKTSRADAIAQALNAFGGGQPAAAAPAADAAPVAAQADMSLPRGIRNNNPLNIEAGGFTQGQPGFAGSDGRFAKFETPEQGTAAAGNLLDIYRDKHGLNTPAGIIGRWAPTADGNNSSAYAANVAKALNIGPNDAIPPELRPQLIAAMGQQENGRPIAPQGAHPQAPPQQVAQAAPQGPVGAPPPQANRAALAALLNPWTPPAVQGALAKQLTPEYGFQTLPDGTIVRTNPRTGQVEPTYSAPAKPELKDGGTDPITGVKTYLEYDPKTRTMRPINGAGAPGAAPQSGMLAPGVTELNHSLTGDDYLKQFGPEVQAAVKSYINGDVMPTGNPRLQGMANQAKIIAQKYGADLGIPVNDSIYAAKRKMQTDLASSTPNSTGGIISNGKSAFGHLANASDKFVDINSYNGPDVPGGGHVATAGNYIANVVAPTSTTQGKIGAAADNLLKYGQESTKFYAGSGGGEGERMAALKAFNPKTTSGNEQAAFLEAEKQLMLERLHQKEMQIEGIMGPKYLEDHPVRTKDLQAAISKIDANISRLRGQGGPDAGAATPDRSAIEAEMRKRGLLK